MVDAIINAMLSLVDKHGLTLMKRYPRDLLVHDRAVLERIAVPGGSAAWLVGHSHTHLVPLGIHRESSALLGHLKGIIDRDDRFYRIDFGRGQEGFSFHEIDRDQFIAMQSRPIAYQRTGYGPDFKLYSGERYVGHCDIKCTDRRTHQYEAHITPALDASKLDRAALYEWVGQEVVAHGGTLFSKWTNHWHETEAQAELEPA